MIIILRVNVIFTLVLISETNLKYIDQTRSITNFAFTFSIYFRNFILNGFFWICTCCTFVVDLKYDTMRTVKMKWIYVTAFFWLKLEMEFLMDNWIREALRWDGIFKSRTIENSLDYFSNRRPSGLLNEELCQSIEKYWRPLWGHK